MRPPFTRFDSADSVLANTIIGCNFALKPRIGANGAHLRFGQFGRRASLSSIGSAVFNAIKLVVSGRVPTKIAQMVIPRISVVMAALHAFRPWANKSGQNQCVWLKNLNFVVFPQPNKRAIFLFIKRVSFFAPRSNGSQSPSVRDLINTFVPNNSFPSFHVFPRRLHMGILA